MIILYVAQALAATLVGALLLSWAQQNVQEEKAPQPRFWTVRRTGAAMMASQVALALFLPLYYGILQEDLLRTLLMVSILWPCAWADSQVCLIPNRILFLGGILSLVLLGMEILRQPQQMLYLVLRVAVATVALLLVTLLCRLISPKAVGMGDVKLLTVMGLCLGSNLVWPALFFSFVVLFLVCAFLLASHRAKRNDSIPFAPFLLIGTLLAAFLTGI